MTDHLTARYGLIHGAYWASYAAIAAYVNLYLLEMGFSSGAIGVLIALAGLLSALLQPLAASYADRETSPNLKAINLAIAALWMLSALGLLVFHKNKVASLLFYGGCLSLLQLQTPLVNGLGVTSINCGCKLNYGVSKSVSSVTYALVCLVLGRMTAAQGGRPVPWAIVLLTGVFILSLVLYPAQRTPRSGSEAKGADGLAFFRKYPRFTGVLAGCILLYISHVFLNKATLQIIRTKGRGQQPHGPFHGHCSPVGNSHHAPYPHAAQKESSSFYIASSRASFPAEGRLPWLAPQCDGRALHLQATQIGAWALIAIASIL